MKINNVRFIIAAIVTFTAFSAYLSRVNLSIAIIAMIDDHHAGGHKTVELSTSLKPSTNQTAVPSGDSSKEPLNDPAKAPPLGELGASDLNSAYANLTSRKMPREPLTTLFPASKETVRTPLLSQETFHWNQIEQGYILGAFFYGYILFQIPGARMAESLGAKWIIMAVSVGSAVISLVFPLSTQLNSIHLLMVLRFVMGLCQSAFFPASYVLYSRWFPEHERSVLLPMMLVGSSIGNISTYIFSSYLISSSYGWPSVFYMSGFVCLLCSILWCIFGSSSPSDNWFITDSELQLIESSVNDQSSESSSLDGRHEKDYMKQPKKINGASSKVIVAASKPEVDLRECRQNEPVHVTPTPSWSKLLTSVPVWALILTLYGNEWSNAVLCYEFPTYLNTALGFPIEQNGVINSFYHLSFAVAAPIMSALATNMLDRHVWGMHKIHVRKLFQSLATFGQMICYICMPLCGPNRGLIITFMFMAVVFRACSSAGDIMVAVDLSPEYAGTLFAVANSVGNTGGFFVPLLAGLFVQNPYARDQWANFWFSTAFIMGFSGLVFLIFGETRQQDFSRDKHMDLELPETIVKSKN